MTTTTMIAPPASSKATLSLSPTPRPSNSDHYHHSGHQAPSSRHTAAFLRVQLQLQLPLPSPRPHHHPPRQMPSSTHSSATASVPVHAPFESLEPQLSMPPDEPPSPRSIDTFHVLYAFRLAGTSSAVSDMETAFVPVPNGMLPRFRLRHHSPLIPMASTSPSPLCRRRGWRR